MLYDLESKTLTWKLIKLLEPAKIVHARCTTLFTDNNVFAQVTARLHSQQVILFFSCMIISIIVYNQVLHCITPNPRACTYTQQNTHTK